MIRLDRLAQFAKYYMQIAIYNDQLRIIFYKFLFLSNWEPIIHGDDYAIGDKVTYN